MEIEILRKCCQISAFKVTNHGLEEMENDNILLEDIKNALQNGEIIEDYPTDFPFPSCLVLGWNKENDPIHMVWAFNKEKEMAILVTTYKPDESKWLNYRTRIK